MGTIDDKDQRIGRPKLIRQAVRPPLPTSEYIEVTPDMAREWLSGQERNRTIHDIWVERYAERITRGDWLITDQGISFDLEGKLINGQHRLSAIVKANKSIVLLVTRGLQARSQLVMDQGIKRQVHEQIALREGWTVLPIHIAVAKSMVGSVGGPDSKARMSLKTDAQVMERFYRTHREVIEWTVYQFSQEPFVRGVSIAPVMGPVARAKYTEDSAELMRFVKVVVTGMSEHRNDQPAVVLRNSLFAERDKGSSHSTTGRNNAYKRTEIALRAFLDAEQIGRLSQMALHKELWPLPEELAVAPRKVVKAR